MKYQQSKPKGFPLPDKRYLEAAEGWLELTNWREANEELENIRPELRGHPYVLELRYPSALMFGVIFHLDMDTSEELSLQS